MYLNYSFTNNDKIAKRETKTATYIENFSLKNYMFLFNDVFICRVNICIARHFF